MSVIIGRPHLLGNIPIGLPSVEIAFIQHEFVEHYDNDGKDDVWHQHPSWPIQKEISIYTKQQWGGISVAAGFDELLAYVQSHGTLHPNQYPDYRLPVSFEAIRILKGKPVVVDLESFTPATIRIAQTTYRIALRTRDLTLSTLHHLKTEPVFLNAYRWDKTHLILTDANCYRGIGIVPRPTLPGKDDPRHG